MPKKSASGTAGVYERPLGSGVYWVRYRVGGKDRRERIGLKSLAKTVLAKRRTEIAEGRFLAVRRVASVAEVVVDNLQRTRNAKDYRHRIEQARFWTRALGSRPVREVTPGEIERVLSSVGKDRAAATVNRKRSFIARIFSQAIEDDLADKNPAIKVRRLKENNARSRFFSPDEEARVLAAMPDAEARALVTLALHTGLRRAEQWRLKWSDIGLDGRSLRVMQAKSGEGRWVPVNRTAREALDALYSLREGDAVCRGTASGLVRRRWARALVRAGVGDFRWHDLRHTFASKLAIAGTPIHTIQRLLGHSTIEMTMRYAHLSPGHLADAVAVLDRNGTEMGTENSDGSVSAG
jgi:integrase